jgi:hypothetical protein
MHASFPTLLFASVIIAVFIAYTFMMRSFNKRYQMALNRFLSKELAHRIYQRLHPEFKYDVYHIDDQNERRLLDETLKEFDTLILTQKEA